MNTRAHKYPCDDPSCPQFLCKQETKNTEATMTRAEKIEAAEAENEKMRGELLTFLSSEVTRLKEQSNAHRDAQMRAEAEVARLTAEMDERDKMRHPAELPLIARMVAAEKSRDEWHLRSANQDDEVARLTAELGAVKKERDSAYQAWVDREPLYLERIEKAEAEVADLTAQLEAERMAHFKSVVVEQGALMAEFEKRKSAEKALAAAQEGLRHAAQFLDAVCETDTSVDRRKARDNAKSALAESYRLAALTPASGTAGKPTGKGE